MRRSRRGETEAIHAGWAFKSVEGGCHDKVRTSRHARSKTRKRGRTRRLSESRRFPLVEAEPATTAWFATRLSASTFGIFDVFPDEAGRDTHLGGEVAKALLGEAPELLSTARKIEKIDILASKLR